MVLARRKRLIDRPRLHLELLEARTLLSLGSPVQGENDSQPPVADALGIDLGALFAANPEAHVTADGSIFLASRLTLPSDVFILNANAADTTNADQLRSGGGLGLSLTGSGVIVGVWDGGTIRSTHQEFANGSRITVIDTPDAEDHPTHVAGTIGAQGIHAPAHGMASQVVLRSRDLLDDRAEIQADAGLIDLSNHSYAWLRGWTKQIIWDGLPAGTDTWVADRTLFDEEDPGFGKYQAAPSDVDASLGADFAYAEGLDEILFDNPSYLGVWAAGNDRGQSFSNFLGTGEYMTFLSDGADGPGWYLVSAPVPTFDGGATGFDTLPQAQVAKNILTIGAVEDLTLDPYTSANILATGFTSFGPTDDGRIKPDLVANGRSLTSSLASSDTAYGNFTGTSMSAPNATGTLALLIEHYRNLHAGASPLAATQKAVALHTASDAGNIGPDYKFGWGLLNGAAAANLLTDAAGGSPTSLVSEAAYTGTTFSLPVVSDGSGPLKVTMVWTDPEPTVLPGPGVDDPTSVLVHDLDLTVVGPGGTHLPWALNPAVPDGAAVREANHADNVEQVLIDAPAAGIYTVTVNRMGATFNQDFSLVASGLTGIEPPNSSVAGRHLFYNQSFFDGNNASATAGDDAAIDTTKSALLPGSTGSFANYSGYSSGLNGVMVDIAGPHGTIGIDDFGVKVGNNNTPGTWAAGPAPTSVTLRAGAGVGGADRYTLIWANGAIARQWAQITVLANANTNLAANDVFYFGNAIGEVGNTTGNAIVTSADEALIRLSFTTGFGTVPVTSRYDLNKDRFVQTSDAALSRANQTTAVTALRLIVVPAAGDGGGGSSTADFSSLDSGLVNLLANARRRRR